MPPRLSLLQAPSQWRSCLSQLAAPLSTTARKPALQNLNSPSETLLGIDEDGTRRPVRPTATAINEVLRANRADSQIDALANVVTGVREHRRMRDSARTEARMRTAEQLRKQAESDAYAKQVHRRWRVGDVYAPHDLSAEEQSKHKRRPKVDMDILDAVGVNPVDEYRNFAFISSFMMPTGRIKAIADTGLRPVNQRRMAKAVRRAIGLGIHPSVHRHPELLKMGQKSMRLNNPTDGKATEAKLKLMDI